MWLRRAARWLAGAAIASLLLPVGAACAPSVERGDGAEGVDARALLERIQTAANRSNYRGTLVVSAGNRLSSSRVTHYCVGEQSYEQVEALDGHTQLVYRHDDVVQTRWPQRRLALIETRMPWSGLPSHTQAVEPRALDGYTLRPQDGDERVAGRAATVLLLEPRDALRYAERLWVDRASGLVLRMDVIGEDRRVLESSAFSEIEIGIKARPAPLLKAMQALDGYKVLRSRQRPTALEAEGWAMTAGGVPGFTLVACVKRPLHAALGTGDGAEVVQAVYSDGVSRVSVFVERFEPKRHSAPLAARIGATSTIMQRRGDYWLTVMGDVPPATLERFADALRRRP